MPSSGDKLPFHGIVEADSVDQIDRLIERLDEGGTVIISIRGQLDIMVIKRDGKYVFVDKAGDESVKGGTVRW
ncbi:MAG: hypothetical protein J5813_06550 [Candidatus Methanomethylophilaceae archaeon]|nr:hypothetical protein [Candidatus Methanomethylophilaceae archaeon]